MREIIVTKRGGGNKRQITSGWKRRGEERRGGLPGLSAECPGQGEPHPSASALETCLLDPTPAPGPPAVQVAGAAMRRQNRILYTS